MEELKSLIQQVDDDYLIGLSNKGTVKRAYKDLEQEQPKASWQGGEAEVSLKEETCVVRVPLGESSCSCPSRSICRHVITAILWLKKSAEDEPASEEMMPKSGSASAEMLPKNGSASSETTALKQLEEVLQLPLEKLRRTCGSNRFRQLVSRLRAGEIPSMEETSIVTVTLPWDNVIVKLLEPFAYSACSCHSQELCVHKAQAALIYQLQKGKITVKDLEALLEDDKSLDKEQVKKACIRVKDTICHQISVGLSRHFQEASDELERLAVITHQTGLAQLESWLREAAAMYDQYGSRSAAFRTDELLRRLLRLYHRANRLLFLCQDEDQEQLRALAGTFRDAYEMVGELHLMGMGSREFHSKTGYEGEIYYFLETRQGMWYTWTDARPVFYEKTRRRPTAAMDNASAPWGLPCSREEMMQLTFSLKDAKAASGGRLSVSQETKGEIIGKRDLTIDGFTDKIIWDYEELAEQYFSSYQEQNSEGRREQLVLVGAVRWGETSFDQINQRFSWSLYDEEGRTLFISLRYTKEEKTLIRLLERLEQRLKKKEQERIRFFGFLYLDEDGRPCLYPIEFFQPERLAEPGRGGNSVEQNMPEKPSGVKQTAEYKDIPGPQIIQVMEQYQREAGGQLNDLFVSGLDSVQDAVIERLKETAEDGERLGLHLAGSAMDEISRMLQNRRHQMEFTQEPIVDKMAELCRYLTICQQKIIYDKVRLTMREETQYESE